MKKKILCIAIILVISVSGLVCATTNIVDRFDLNQEKNLLYAVGSLTVIDSNTIIITDYKAGDIKIYGKKGNLRKIFGRKGNGPDEFQAPMAVDHYENRIVFEDADKSRFLLYEFDKRSLAFKALNSYLCLYGLYDIKFYKKDWFLISGYKNSKKGKYELFRMNSKTGEKKYILPMYYKYGFSSQKHLDVKYTDEVAPLGLYAFVDINRDDAYFVWKADIKILKIDLKTNSIKKTFGHKSGNYIQPYMTKRRLELDKSGNIEKVYKEDRKMSWITGIFTASDYVGVVYANYLKKISSWQYFLQLYSMDGKFLDELKLKDAIQSTHFPLNTFCFNKKEQILYFLSRYVVEADDADEIDDKYSIVKYKIKK